MPKSTFLIDGQLFRRCSICKKILPIEGFHHRPDKRANYHTYGCRACYTKKHCLASRSEAIWKSARDWAKDNRTPEKMREHNTQYYWNNHEKVMAETYIHHRIRSGKVKRQPCIICSKPNGVAHHSDYSRPGHIFWLCQRHHMWVHRKYEPIVLSEKLACDY